MSFSKRNGLAPIKPPFQTNALSRELRSGLWNALLKYFFDNVPTGIYGVISKNERNGELVSFILQELWAEYYRRSIDQVPARWDTAKTELRAYVYGSKWFEVFDLLEFIVTCVRRQNYARTISDQFIKECNRVFERENSAYRFVGDHIIDLTSENEIREVEDALRSKFAGPRTHIETALARLTDRKSPDFRNSIKESISAVESTCNNLLGRKTKSLTDALTSLESQKMIKLHKAEKKGFESLYGYTSDSDGIRHGLLEEVDLEHEDAKFMLVACSAFCNFLIGKTSVRK